MIGLKGVLADTCRYKYRVTLIDCPGLAVPDDKNVAWWNEEVVEAVFGGRKFAFEFASKFHFFKAVVVSFEEELDGV